MTHVPSEVILAELRQHERHQHDGMPQDAACCVCQRKGYQESREKPEPRKEPARTASEDPGAWVKWLPFLPLALAALS